MWRFLSVICFVALEWWFFKKTCISTFRTPNCPKLATFSAKKFFVVKMFQLIHVFEMIWKHFILRILLRMIGQKRRRKRSGRSKQRTSAENLEKVKMQNALEKKGRRILMNVPNRTFTTLAAGSLFLSMLSGERWAFHLVVDLPMYHTVCWGFL